MKNNTLTMNLNETEMLSLWKKILNLEPVRRDCSIEREDGIDIDAMLLLHIKQWYAALLASAPLTWLPIDDVTSEVALTTLPDGIVTASLPDRCIRPVEWRLEGWKCSVTHFCDAESPLGRMQKSEFLRGRNEYPVIVQGDAGLTLYSVTPGSNARLKYARCVVIPADGHYVFSCEAITTIPHFNDTLQLMW